MPAIVEVMRLLAILAAIALPALPVNGDVVRLKSGGEVRGTLNSRPNAETVEVETLDGIIVSLDRDRISAIVVRSLDAERYVERAREIDDTVDAHLELAEWCRSHRLRNERLDEFRAVLRLDPTHEEAHQALGHVLHEGTWITRDAKMLADGFVKVGRRWVTPAEAALMEKIDEESEQAKAWFPKALELKRRLNTPFLLAARPVLDEVASNDDPTALAAWLRTFGDHPVPAVRVAMIVAISKMNSVSAIQPLAKFAVEDSDAGVRQAAVMAMPAQHRDLAVRAVAEWLENEENTFVLRAAEAIETLGDDAATIQLVRALETAHWQVVQEVDPTPSFSVGGGDIGFGTPNIIYPQDLGTGQTGLIGPIAAPPRVRTKRIRVAVRNAEVLRALIATTGQNFGYDERRWMAWWRRSNG